MFNKKLMELSKKQQPLDFSQFFSSRVAIADDQGDFEPEECQPSSDPPIPRRRSPHYRPDDPSEPATPSPYTLGRVPYTFKWRNLDFNWDDLEDVDNTGAATRIMYFITHAPTDHMNPKEVLPDVHREINHTRQRMSELCPTMQIKKVYQSSYPPCKHTYEMFKRTGYFTNAQDEQRAVNFPPTPTNDEPYRYSPYIFPSNADEEEKKAIMRDHIRLTAGETTRLEAAFREFFKRMPAMSKRSCLDRKYNEVYFCPPNAVQYFFIRANQFPLTAWKRLHLDPCSISTFIVKPNGNVFVKGFGERSHFYHDGC